MPPVVSRRGPAVMNVAQQLQEMVLPNSGYGGHDHDRARLATRRAGEAGELRKGDGCDPRTSSSQSHTRGPPPGVRGVPRWPTGVASASFLSLGLAASPSSRLASEPSFSPHGVVTFGTVVVAVAVATALEDPRRVSATESLATSPPSPLARAAPCAPPTAAYLA